MVTPTADRNVITPRKLRPRTQPNAKDFRNRCVWSARPALVGIIEKYDDKRSSGTDTPAHPLAVFTFWLANLSPALKCFPTALCVLISANFCFALAFWTTKDNHRYGELLIDG